MQKADTNLKKVAVLALVLTKNAGIGGYLKNLFTRSKKLSLKDLLAHPEYAAYLTTKFKNPTQQGKALGKIQENILKMPKTTLSPEALLHLAEQKQLLEQMQGLSSERLWNLAERYGQYAAEKPAQALAGTLAGGYATTKGAETVKDLIGGDEKSGKSRNVFVTS